MSARVEQDSEPIRDSDIGELQDYKLVDALSAESYVTTEDNVEEIMESEDDSHNFSSDSYSSVTLAAAQKLQVYMAAGRQRAEGCRYQPQNGYQLVDSILCFHLRHNGDTFANIDFRPSLLIRYLLECFNAVVHQRSLIYCPANNMREPGRIKITRRARS